MRPRPAAAIRLITRWGFSLFPSVRRPWLRILLRVYQWLFGYLTFVSGQCFGTSPKHLFEWGAAGFVVPKVRPGARVLDVGCGRGELAWEVGRVARCVVGYDKSFANVAQASRRAGHGRVLFYCGDAEAAVPVRAHFDTVILSSILPFVEDPQSFLTSLREIAAELIVRETRYDRDFTVPLMQSLGLVHRTDSFARREYTYDALVRELADAGWLVRECRNTYDMYVWAVRGPAPTSVPH